MTTDELAEKIKAKYPDYASMDNQELVEKITSKYPDYKAQLDPAYDTSLAGRDARISALTSPMIEGAKAALNTALPGPSFNQPIQGQTSGGLADTPMAALNAAGQTLRDPTRISPTVSQPGQVAGNTVSQGLQDSGVNPTLAKGAGIVTGMALDPQTYMLGGASPTDSGAGAVEDFAAQQANKAAGITPKTIANMAKSGENPASVGNAVGKDLIEAGALKGSAKNTWQAVSNMTKQAGKSVGDALDAIKTATKAIGSDVADSSTELDHAIDSKTALQPLMDAWTERAGGMTSARKAMAKPFEEVYQGLSDAAKKQGGALTLENVKAALDEVGPMVHKGSEEVQASMGELYGTLADMRDKMVEHIAQNSGNPTLAADLLNANKKYSMYIRLMPDLAKNAAKESVGKGVGIDQPMKYVVNKLAPKIASAALGASKIATPVWTAGKTLSAAALSPFRGPELQAVLDRLKNSNQQP